MAVVIARCHNLACKSLPEREERRVRSELILFLYFIISFFAIGMVPKVLETFITWSSAAGDGVGGPYHLMPFKITHIFPPLNQFKSLFPLIHTLNLVLCVHLFVSCFHPCPAFICSAMWLLPSSDSQQTSTAKRSTTDNVNHAACDWQVGKMAVAAHRGMENPFFRPHQTRSPHQFVSWRKTGAQTQLIHQKRLLVGGTAQRGTNPSADGFLSVIFFFTTTPLFLRRHLLTPNFSWKSMQVNVIF